MTLTTNISPCLWFDANAEEAVNFYTSVFPNSRILGRSHYGDAGPGPVGSVMVVTFELDGKSFMALNGGPIFTFSEAISLVVSCDSQEEIDRYWKRLLEGGGHEQQCGWLKDRFGLSWQIVPRELNEAMSAGDAAANNRVMAAILKMVKLDLAAIRAAYKGA